MNLARGEAMAIEVAGVKLRSVGETAAFLGWPEHRVSYVLRTRRIAPSGRGGVLRLLDEEAVERVREACAEIDRRRRRPAAR